MTQEELDKELPLEKYIRSVVQLLIIVVSLIGFYYFNRSLNDHETLVQALYHFIPTVIFSALLIFHKFAHVMSQQDFQTYIFFVILLISIYFLYRWAIETDAKRAENWFSAFAALAGFALGIPTGRIGKGK